MPKLINLARLPIRLIRATPGLVRFFRELRHQRRDPKYINSEPSYFLMRTLYVLSGGYLTEVFNWFVSKRRLPKTTLIKGIKPLPLQDTAVLAEIKGMRCYVSGKPNALGLISDFSAVDEGTIRVTPADLFASKSLAQFATNDRWLAEAREIIGTDPIAIGIDAWWSKPCSQDRLSDAAQMWHRDLDRLRDVKIFFYATDVAEENGPFEYVTGSHLPSLRAVSRSDGRLTNQWVESRYPNQAVTMTGPTGTAFIADTHGIHRGRPVQRGLRCALQFYFSSSLFGAEPFSQPRIALDPTWPSFPIWRDALDRNPRAWGPLFSSTCLDSSGRVKISA